MLIYACMLISVKITNYTKLVIDMICPDIEN